MSLFEESKKQLVFWSIFLCIALRKWKHSANGWFLSSRIGFDDFFTIYLVSDILLKYLSYLWE